MTLQRYPDIVIGEAYSMDVVSQALRDFDPKFENPQARECLHLPIERRPWGHRGRGGYMPGPQPGCKDNGTDIDYPPIVGLSPEDFQHRQTYPVKPQQKWTPHEMPKLLVPDNWTFPYISYLPKIPYLIGPTDHLKQEGINVPTYPHPEVADALPFPATPLP
jgi:hypothetical protein